MADFAKFQKALKLVAFYQLTLEAMDDFENTPLYKGRIKQKMNSLKTDIEHLIRQPLANLDRDEDSQELLTHLLKNIETIMGLSAEDLAKLQIVIEEEITNH